jgi:hypothetical protein
MSNLNTQDQLALLMDLNMLQYSPPVDASLVNYRQFKKYSFSPSNYAAGATAQIQVNSGSDYISGPTSYIEATITSAAGKWASDENKVGCAFNIFKEWQHSHRSGDVLDRVDNLNYLVNLLIAFSQDDNYNNYSEVFGNNENAVIGTQTYVFPLWLCSGLFAQAALLPSFLMAGSRINIKLESNEVALQSAVASTYTVDKMDLVLDSCDLFDAAKKVLMTSASNVRTQGLQYPYYSWYNLQKNGQTAADLNFDLNLSAAKTMILLIGARDTTQTLAKDSMSTIPYNYAQWRARLGSMTFPQHEVTSSAESYHLTTEAFAALPVNDLNHPKKASIGVSYSQYNTIYGAVAVSMEKSPCNIIQLSGNPTNNSQLLNFSSKLNAVPAGGVSYDAYIKHLRVCNIMLDNVVVDK